MTRKTGNKWKTEKCGRCEEPHEGYSGKLDKDNVEYVVCQHTNKRIDVAPDGTDPRHFMFYTEWKKI
jgi:hypothetical protein